jgi:hypothetical protein
MSIRAKAVSVSLFFLVCSIVICAPTGAQDQPRTRIMVVPYIGDKVQFQSFRGIIETKIDRLKEDFPPKYAYTRDLHLEDAETKPSDFEGFWRETGSLAILSGIVFPQQQRSYVKSTFYLYDLKGNLGSNSVTLDLAIEPEEYGATRDTHSIVTLYALAMDAKRLGSSPDVVSRFLSRAYEISTSLPSSARKGDIVRVIDAIKREADSLRTQGGQP